VDVHGRFELVVNARAAGPRLGKDVQTVIKAVKAGDWSENSDGVVVAAGIELLPEEYTQRLVAAEPESTAALPDGAGLVVLDSAVTEELEAEGWAKDRIRELQDARRAAGLEVSDRITVVLDVPEERRDWALAHRKLIAGEILAVELELAEAPGDAVELGEGVRAAIAKA
jgi:isoleucyl-tRNA synthetase